MSILYILCGVPGSGKSTWACKKVEELGASKVAWVSRDKIRFSLLKPNEDYFAHEDEVRSIFIKEVQKAISDEVEYIIADATHLTPKSRRSLVNQLTLSNTEIVYVCFMIPLEEAQKRNAKRSGRTLVPETIICKMYSSFSLPFGNLLLIDEFGKEQEAFRSHDFCL